MTQLRSLSEASLDQLFRQARTVHGFEPVPISEATIRKLYELLKWGPTTTARLSRAGLASVSMMWPASSEKGVSVHLMFMSLGTKKSVVPV